MKKIIVFLVLLLPALLVRAQVHRAEYFIDVDPGYGKGIPVPVAPAAAPGEQIFEFDALLPADMPDGVHILFVRTKSRQGWSQTVSRPFVKTELPTKLPSDLVFVEYFIDTDPGKGKGKSVPFSLLSPSFEFAADLTKAAKGKHTLTIRARYKNNTWETMGKHQFTVN